MSNLTTKAAAQTARKRPPAGRASRPVRRKKGALAENAERLAAGATVAGEAAASKGAQLAALATRFRVPLVVLVVLRVVAGALDPPAQDLYCAWRDQEAHEQQLETLNEDISQYQGDIDRLQTREGIEDEARKRGYVAEGETSLVVEGLPEDEGEDQDDTPDKPWYLALGDFIFQYQEP